MRGLSRATAVTKAAAAALCPDGKDDEDGTGTNRRYGGSTSAAGRRRAKIGFSTALTVKLAPATAITPRTAARRGVPARVDSSVADNSHSML